MITGEPKSKVDEIQTLKEKKANRLGHPIENPIFLEGEEFMRWSRFKKTAPEEMFNTVRDHPFLDRLANLEQEITTGHQALESLLK